MTIHSLAAPSSTMIGAGWKEVKVKQCEYPEIPSIVRIVSIMNVVNVGSIVVIVSIVVFSSWHLIEGRREYASGRPTVLRAG